MCRLLRLRWAVWIIWSGMMCMFANVQVVEVRNTTFEVEIGVSEVSIVDREAGQPPPFGSKKRGRWFPGEMVSPGRWG